MRIKKAIAALLALLMVLSLFSGLTITASAAKELGGPVTIEEITPGAGGIVVPGKELPYNTFILNPKWTTNGEIVSVKLGGIAYRAKVGVNAFATLGEAFSITDPPENKQRFLSPNATIYLCAGLYTAAEKIMVDTGGVKVFGPYGGVCPNDPTDLSQPNPLRPNANSGSGSDEAILSSCVFEFTKNSSDFTLDGVTLSNSSFTLYSNTSDRARRMNGEYRPGTYIRNCVAQTNGDLFNFNVGFNVNFTFEKNRVLNANRVYWAGGVGDFVIADNYLNTTGYIVHPTSFFYAGSIGNHFRFERNYCARIGGFYFSDTIYEIPPYYSLQIYDNYVAICGNEPLVSAFYIDYNTVAGTNVQIKRNEIKGMKQGVTYFRFPRVRKTEVPPRYTINLNENKFDLPIGSPFLSCEADAIIDCSYNYYNGAQLTPGQFALAPEDDLILYPYYKDAAMTVLAGDAKILSVNRENGVLNGENRTVEFDIRGAGVDTYDLTDAFTVSEDCVWKLYADRSLQTELKSDLIYLNGSLTHCFLAVTSPDGAISNLYEIRLIGDVGTEAELLSVEIENPSIPAPVVSENDYTYNLAADDAFVNFVPRVSSGATYTLYSDEELKTPLEDLGGYIPPNGYTVFVKVVSEDQSKQNVYRLIFERERSVIYDPCLLSGVLPDNGSMIRQARRLVSYICQDLLAEATFDFKVTKGAGYGIFSNPECTPEGYLSSGEDLHPIRLKEGVNTFYIRVTDNINSSVYAFSVINGSKSSDTNIEGVVGFNAAIISDAITIAASSDTTSVEFTTRNPYTKVMLYADPDHTIKVSYTPSIQEVAGTAHVIEKRVFSVASGLARTTYYVISEAEDGTTEEYTLSLTRNIYIPTFVDLAENAWYKTSVNAVAASGVMAGSSVNGKDYFRPGENTTRQEMAIVIAQLMGLNAESFSGVSLPYADQSGIADWALNAVKACYKTGLISGSLVGNKVYYNPNQNISRQETMASLVRAFQLNGTADLSRFNDAAQVSDWARASVEAAVAAGIVSGDDKGNLNPKANITRAELAVIIANQK